MAQKSDHQRAIDPRPARTREALYEAIRELSVEADAVAGRSAGGAPAAITVNSLVHRAGVSRSAFYSQFADLDELMVALLIDTFREIGIADLNARHDSKPVSSRALAHESLTTLGEHFRERRAFYTASLGWMVSVRVHQAIVAAFAAQVRETILALDDVPDSADVDASAAYIGGGIVAVLTLWVSTPRPVPVPVLVDQLLALLPTWLTREEPFAH
jgi:AcrR family transcriptional regulator